MSLLHNLHYKACAIISAPASLIKRGRPLAHFCRSSALLKLPTGFFQLQTSTRHFGENFIHPGPVKKLTIFNVNHSLSWFSRFQIDDILKQHDISCKMSNRVFWEKKEKQYVIWWKFHPELILSASHDTWCPHSCMTAQKVPYLAPSALKS